MAVSYAPIPAIRRTAIEPPKSTLDRVVAGEPGSAFELNDERIERAVFHPPLAARDPGADRRGNRPDAGSGQQQHPVALDRYLCGNLTSTSANSPSSASWTVNFFRAVSRACGCSLIAGMMNS